MERGPVGDQLCPHLLALGQLLRQGRQGVVQGRNLAMVIMITMMTMMSMTMMILTSVASLPLAWSAHCSRLGLATLWSSLVSASWGHVVCQQ